MTARVGRLPRVYPFLFRHVLRRLDPERAHHLAFALIRIASAVGPVRAVLAARCRTVAPVDVLGRTFPAPFGLAAGFDKNAEGVRGLLALGFGWVEVGTVTPRPQEGNERPRLWRHVERRAVRNRMGFNNDGAARVAERLRAVRATEWGRDAVIGVNIGKNRTTPEERAADDYATCARVLAPLADYVVVNVSSPNTPGLRDLQATERLRPLLEATRDAVAEVAPGTPVLVKIAPDLADDDVDAVVDLVTEIDLAGVVAVNTTVDHPYGEGGLSGPPLLDRGVAVVRRVRGRLGPDRAVVGVGGITTAADARRYLDAGADLVQGYTGFVYVGPAWAARVNRGLAGRGAA